MKKITKIEGIDCAHCASQIEEKIKKLKGISNVSLSFMTERLTWEAEQEDVPRLQEEIIEAVKKVEPDASVKWVR